MNAKEKIAMFEIKLSELAKEMPALEYSIMFRDRNCPHVLISYIDLMNSFSVHWPDEEPDILIKRLWKCLSGMECKVQESLKFLEKNYADLLGDE